jgi:murein DD-endopeptidase MepM/ murein hydrolase activator NlpD
VIIDHGSGEFTAYSHMRQGSVVVRKGQKVTTGEIIGRCGSSGSGPNPHLHFQLMDGPDMDTARGLPIVFHDYFAPFSYVHRGTPKRGDLILPGLSR